jgi:hypothetical protein
VGRAASSHISQVAIVTPFTFRWCVDSNAVTLTNRNGSLTTLRAVTPLTLSIRSIFGAEGRNGIHGDGFQ